MVAADKDTIFPLKDGGLHHLGFDYTEIRQKSDETPP